MPRRAALAFWLPVAAATALCGGLLFPYLSDRVMHRDEALAVMVARRPLGELLETVQLVRGGAPLHFLLVALVERLGGGLTAARLLSAIAACVAVVAFALLGRALFGPIEGVVAAAGVAACPVALFYGEFARMYALFLAVTALALWCLVRALDEGGRWWVGAAALLALNVYVHPYGVVVGIAAGVAVLVATLRRHERERWRAPLLTGAGVVVGTLPLAAGYLVLASRHGAVHTPNGSPLRTPPTLDTVHQAFANFFGVPRADSLLTPTGLYVVAAALLVLIGLVLAARRDPAHGVLLALLLVLPPLVIAFVQVPGTDNHVRYVIEALPAVLVCLAHGGVELARRASPIAAVAVGAALVVALPVVDLERGRHLADYRYRGGDTSATRHALDGAAAWLRQSFATNDVVFGYDPVWGNAVLHPGTNAALKDARGTARAEGPLIVRSLDRLHGPIAHGWYVALVRKPAGLPAFRASLGSGFEARRFGGWVVVRTTAPTLDRHSFARDALRVFRAAGAELGDPQAPTTSDALSAALPDIRP
ncbi:MAG: mannosyltransferase [Gaiellales bacterium]|nr:mannosyltransferase [Gaiellales bacterium]